MMSLSLSAICLIALTNHVSYWTTGSAVVVHSMVTSSEPLPQGKTAKKKKAAKKKEATKSEEENRPDVNIRRKNPDHKEPNTAIDLTGLSLENPGHTKGPPPQPANFWSRERVKSLIERSPSGDRATLMSIYNSSDQARLAKLALTENDLTRAAVAVHTLTDQTLLIKVASEAKREEIRRFAADRLDASDQPGLIKLVESTKDTQVRARAIRLITDDETGNKLNAKYNAVSVRGDERQMKEEMDKLVYEKDPNERQTEIKSAVKADPLRIVALRDPFPTNPSAAVKRLIELRKMDMPGTGERLFQEIVLSAKDGDARRIAVSQVTNLEVLMQAADDEDSQVRFAVIAQTNDKKILAKLAEDKIESVQQAAKTKLSQPAAKTKKR